MDYPGDYTREWATLGQLAGAWINLAWPSPVTVSQVILDDRPNLEDNVTYGTLSFSDGSTGGGWDFAEQRRSTHFSARTVTSMKFTITGAAGYNIGLAGVAVSASPATAVSTVSLNPTTAAGGSSSAGAVALNGVAPTGGAVVTLSSSNGAAQVPASISSFTAGQSIASFTVTTTAVSSSTSLSITASYSGNTASANLTISPATVNVATLTLNPATVVSGNSVTGTVTLASAAPAGGASVALSSDTSTTMVPANVVVPSGQTSATFTVTTSVPAAPVTATLTAKIASSSQTATLRQEIAVAATWRRRLQYGVVTGQRGRPNRSQGGGWDRGWISGRLHPRMGGMGGCGPAPGSIWRGPAQSRFRKWTCMTSMPNSSGHALPGTLSFSNGSTVAVGTCRTMAPGWW